VNLAPLTPSNSDLPSTPPEHFFSSSVYFCTRFLILSLPVSCLFFAHALYKFCSPPFFFLLLPPKVGGHNERAYVTKAEMAAMKQWGEPGIVMLGFVNKEWLKPWYY
jgi:hypothetical protein